MHHRRHVLEVLGGLPALTALGACSANAAKAGTSVPDAIAAWRAPGAGQTDVRRFALAHAILAPNPHNRQPWLITLVGEDEIILHFDTTRRLPVTDPFDRQLTIGCGAFLELLSIASAQMGYDARITLFPEGQPDLALDTKPLARIQLVAGGTKSPLFGAITKRRSHKIAYDKRRNIADATLKDLIANLPQAGLSYAASLRGEPICETLRSITKRAYRREVETPLALKESVDLMRFGKREIQRHRDGIDIDFPFIDVLVASGQVTRAKMMTPGTSVYEQGLANYDPLADSAAGYVWIISDAGDRVSQIATGRAYAQLNLRAAQLGLALHPMSQALQEYSQMASIKDEVDACVAVPSNKRLQMLARIGYAKDIPPAPRRGLQEHMV